MGFGVGDIRVERSGDWLMEQIAATGSLTLRKVGASRSGEMRAHRFLSSGFASVEAIMETLGARTAERCAGRRVVAAQDTSEINFAGRSAKRRGLGPAGNGCDPGFFIHPVLAIDADDEAVVGLVDARIWTRPQTKAPARRGRAFEDKESARWLEGCASAAEQLGAAAEVTVVGDRESDIFQLFARRPEGVHLVVRAAQDRRIEGGSLFEAAAAAAPLTTTMTKVAPRGPGDKGRLARVELRAVRVRLLAPASLSAKEKTGAPAVELTLVEAREIEPPEGVASLLWRLLTTHAAETAEQAREIVRCYRLRWRIEQLFRTLKSDGLALEDSQIVDAERLMRLSAVALGAAARIIQLVDARDGGPRSCGDVVDEALVEPLEAIGKTLEGKTERQKNPHEKGSLAWLAWITARLGGWNCYYKPPGPKTMRDGWNRLASMLAGYAIATAKAFP
ncbi:IS4 family transposase [Methylosinus trichosporium]|uniref:Transposase n=1 Tax=Methylosinus trichosporium (strain ATCC 35070 / NCIMB 11131 / UNIQEM 75 / OB3b) TaxID=595536 RepID=A0A2D2D4Z1_METT3|nr:IS4 family transposase [Methylosinus trichosporium]ATQ66489.1 transposase [Methylosinus trichosporium OB3b]ATQ70035.1 transposase [Methylosinus trichosporium OB3b]ATQ70571.1 transposase [Methylosinus trichosporium OB3b]